MAGQSGKPEAVDFSSVRRENMIETPVLSLVFGGEV